jgi:hypothetical protein
MSQALESGSCYEETFSHLSGALSKEKEVFRSLEPNTPQN